MYSIEELANDSRKLDVRAGDTVTLHASVRAVGGPCGRNLVEFLQEHGMGVIRLREMDAFVNTGRLIRSYRGGLNLAIQTPPSAPDAALSNDPVR